MTRLRIALGLTFGAACFSISSESRGQNFVGGATAFDPEISVVESGALLDTQAVVSADRKYVTLNMRPQLSTLIALREFTFQGPGGVVGLGSGGGGQGGSGQGGSGQAPGATRQPNGGRADGRGPLLPAFARDAQPTPVLQREGMTRLDTPKAAASPAAGK